MKFEEAMKILDVPQDIQGELNRAMWLQQTGATKQQEFLNSMRDVMNWFLLATQTHRENLKQSIATTEVSNDAMRKEMLLTKKIELESRGESPLFTKGSIQDAFDAGGLEMIRLELAPQIKTLHAKIDAYSAVDAEIQRLLKNIAVA